MSRQIYVNIPVKNLERSRKFFTSLGFQFDSNFSDDKALSLVVSENIYIMLLVEGFFKTFINKELCDTSKNTEVLIALSCESRDEVDKMVRKAVHAGGSVPRGPQDHGFMYGHAFEDLDGHIWELLYIDPGS